MAEPMVDTSLRDTHDQEDVPARVAMSGFLAHLVTFARALLPIGPTVRLSFMRKVP